MTRKKESGQALLIAAAALGIVLMGFAGLGIDMGYMRYEKRLQQTAADAAAIAGAAELPYGSAGVQNAAYNDAKSNGFTNDAGCPGVGCVTVTVNNPPTSGPHNAAAGYVEVLVAQVQPTFFMRILGIKSETVTARAVATDNANSAGCIYLLGPSGNDLSITGAGNSLSLPNCGIVDDSNLSVTGAGDSIDAASIGVHGSYSHTGAGITVTPTPVTGIVAAADPLSYLTPPTPVGGACQAQLIINETDKTVSVPSGNYCNGVTINGVGNTVTFNQGNYDGISITGSNNNITFNSGTYTVGGNFSVVGANDTLNGSSVTFYTYNNGSFTLTGAGLIANLSAPNSGADAAMLFWQASNDANAASFTGAGISTNLQGAFYFPDAGVTMTGAGSSALYTFIVAQSLTLTGAGITLPINSNISGLTGGSPIKSALLVE